MSRESTAPAPEGGDQTRREPHKGSGVRTRARFADPAEPPRSELLRKPVNALAIVPQAVRITYLARKAYNVLLYEAQNQGIEQDVYRAPLEMIIRGVDFDSNDTALVKKHLRGMVTTTVEWQSPTTGEGVAWNVSGLLAHARLFKDRGQMWVEWSYAINLKQELLEPTVFARLRLEVLTQLRSHAAVALYEICSRYREVGRTARNPWRWWHPVLTGQPPDEKKLAKLDYRFFKRDTLKGAVAEVSAITDLDVELIEHRRGRFIEEIQFAITPKRQSALPLSEMRRPVDLSLVKRAAELGVGDTVAERLIEEYGEEAFAGMLPALQRRAASSFPEPLKDPSRYARALLGHASPPAAMQPPEPVPAPAPQKVKAEWVAVWRERRVDGLKQEIAALSPPALQSLVATVEDDLEARKVHPSVLRRLRQSGWTHPLVVMEVVRTYAVGAHGEHWDEPDAQALLAVAAELAHRPAS